MGNEDLSSALGWVSIACWIVVYSPQIIENYTLKSGEGLSVIFVIVWLLGDLCNLAGAVMARLQSTVVILAVYYSLCDITLLSQIYYYRHRMLLARPVQTATVTEECTPLLYPQPPNSEADMNINAKPGSRSSTYKAVLRYTLCLVFVMSAGITAWLINRHHRDDPDSGNEGPKVILEWKSQAMGWMSAVLYLGSRIPQILKNFETRCEGLSLALFLFCIAGNVTYVLSICTLSMEREHIIANASWLAGSGLTVFLDFIVLGQFFYFRTSDPVPGFVIVADSA